MKKYYEGGFEPTMTKAEAALILGIRRSASVKKILGIFVGGVGLGVVFEGCLALTRWTSERHRKLIVANHPDRGGSPLIAAKVKCFLGTRGKKLLYLSLT